MTKAISISLLLVLMLLSTHSIASPQFEFGKLNYDNCLNQVCEIKFDTEFDSKPYVFVMPTIGTGDNGKGDWRSAPSAIRIMGVGLKKATFRQFAAPYSKLAFDSYKEPLLKQIKPKPMTEFHYLAIEKGTINLPNGGKIVAGEVSTNEYVWGRVNWQKIKSGWDNEFNTHLPEIGYGLRFDKTPGILTQIQTTNNKYQDGKDHYYKAGEPVWLTSLGWDVEGRKHSEMRLALDISEVHRPTKYKKGRQSNHRNIPVPKIKETVAYVAAEGSGFISGKKFWMGSIQTKNTHKDPDNGNSELGNSVQDRLVKPVTIACQHNDLEFVEDFPSAPVILVGKNSRSGPNGGWIRRCKLNKDRVTVQVEEDFDQDSERKHASELAGVFIFEGSKQGAYCDVFPGPAQTWKNNSSEKLIISNHAQIKGTRSIGGKRVVGFANLSGQGLPTGCDDKRCNTEHGLMVDRAELGTFVKLPSAGTDVMQDTTFTQGSHGILGPVFVKKGATLRLTSGEYWNDSMDINGNVFIPKGEKVVIHTKAIALNNNSRFGVAEGSAVDSLVIYVHDEPVSGRIHPQVMLSNNSKFRGLIYSERNVDLSNGVEYFGAITAKDLHLHNNSLINGESACFSPIEDYDIEVTPKADFSLTCDLQEIEFTITNDGSVADSFDGKVRITTDLTKRGQAKWFTSSNGSGQGYDASVAYEATPVAGKVKLWLKSDYVGKVAVRGEILDGDADPASASFSFAPFKFEIANSALKVVAGKPRDITITAKSCRNENRTDVAVGYTGKRTLNLLTAYIAPANGNKSHGVELAKCQPENGVLNSQCKPIADKDWQDSKITLNFDKGVARSVLRYLEAGTIDLNFHDPECTLDKGCELLPKGYRQAKSSLGDWERLEGKQSVWSRPYTFALCQSGVSNIESASGKSDRGVGFVAAGSEFKTLVKPVIWHNGDPVAASGKQPDVDSSRMCSRTVTRNFYHNQGPAAVVALSHKLETPDKKGAVAGELGGTLSQAHSAIGNAPFSLYWSEAGSIMLAADTSSNYLDMDINQGYRPVGRFYPKYLKLASDSIDYPLGQSGFVYMDQNLNFDFIVEAQNAAKNPTKNYGFFADKYKTGLELMVVDNTKPETVVNSLAKRVEYFSRKGVPYTWSWSGAAWNKGGDKQANTAQMSISEPNFTFVRNYYNNTNRSSATRYSREDGPFDSDNTRMGLFIKNNADPLDWDYTSYSGESKLKQVETAETHIGQVWQSKPDIRYGRMVMEDAAGPANSNIAIPLRVEFWNGIEFVVSTEDSVSEYDGRYSCKQIITNSADKLEQGESSNSHTQGSGKVRNGDTQSGQFVAVPHQREGKPVEGYREQVRFWQRLTANKPNNIKQVNKAISCIGSHSSQPWLLHNWRQLGDENPSAVVTFGVYRGNDRIIYRGEKGINTLLN